VQAVVPWTPELPCKTDDSTADPIKTYTNLFKTVSADRAGAPPRFMQLHSTRAALSGWKKKKKKQTKPYENLIKT
jgi:hypothetical protein